MKFGMVVFHKKKWKKEEKLRAGLFVSLVRGPVEVNVVENLKLAKARLKRKPNN